jgi:hypothetical protein
VISLGDRLSVIEGPVVRDLGLPFTTRMTVAQLQDGSLWIESPVPVEYETLARLRELGPVRHLVCQTPRHMWRLEEWHRLFPDAALWGCPPSPITVAHSRLPLAGTLGDRPNAAWADDFDQVAIRGSLVVGNRRLLEEVWFLHRPSRTLIVGDIIQVHAQRPGRPLRNAFLRAAGIAGPEGGTSVDIRAAFWNRRALRASLERVLDWDFDQVVLAHGPFLTSGAKPFVERALAWALGSSVPRPRLGE